MVVIAHRLKRILLSAVVAFGVCHVALTADETAQRRVQIDRESVAAMTASYQLFLEAKPGRGEGMLAFARRFCGDTDAANAIAEANGGVERLLVGVRYRIPFVVLTDDYQLQVITSLFAEDRAVGGGWQHKVGSRLGDSRESLWHLAEWFTGQGENFRVLRQANGLPDDDLAPGQVVRMLNSGWLISGVSCTGIRKRDSKPNMRIRMTPTATVTPYFNDCSTSFI